MRTVIITTSILCYALFFSSCSGNTNANTENNATAMQNNEAALSNLVEQWNSAHVKKDVGAFSQLFDNSVLFYGTQLDKNTCIEKKLALFKKSPDFYQQIYGDIAVEQSGDDEITCSFVKRVTVHQATSDYPSYLVFRNTDDGYKIVVEGDLVTDKNLAKKNSQSNKQDYSFYPEISVISGKIKIETFFGPPGYGENPQTDAREDAYMLYLDSPINVISHVKEREEGDVDVTTYNIEKFQLASTSNVKFSPYKNKTVRVSGIFFGAISGHHHTPVLLDVQKIEEE
ncbi:MAG: DUF4431 domain-containing protein [Bacteroidales bacterium]|jgi:hypothetical protein|nr:DUF4431 domain-containing protein [Bacteroidales bacterium]